MDSTVLLALLLADVGFAAVCAHVALRGLARRRAGAGHGLEAQDRVATVELPEDSALEPTRWVPGRAAMVLATLRLET